MIIGFFMNFAPVLWCEFYGLYFASHDQQAFRGRFPSSNLGHLKNLLDQQVSLAAVVGREGTAGPPASELGAVFQLHQNPFA